MYDTIIAQGLTNDDDLAEFNMLNHQKIITEDKERIDKISKISFDKL